MNAITEIKTNAENLRGCTAPLYHQYPGQTNPQPAWLYIVPDEYKAYAEVNGEIGTAIPMKVWNKLHITVGIPNSIKGDDLADWLESPETQDLLARICNGHEEYWNGHNYVGRIDEDAEEALEELTTDAQDWPDSAMAQIWDAGEWLAPVTYWSDDGTSVSIDDRTITRQTTDDELSEWAEQMEKEAECEVYIHDSIRKHLEYLRDQCVTDDENENDDEDA